MRPNILIFMTDQEQADVVHPDHPCITPNATRLAQEGVLFRRSFCPTAHCGACPSRATFMTGLYPSRHGIYNNVSNPTAIHHDLYDGVGMFSETLRSSGYNLAYAGKWHVTDAENPSDRGWEDLHITAGKGSYMHRSVAQWQEQAKQPESTERERGQILRPGWGTLPAIRFLPDRYPERLRRSPRLSRCPIRIGRITAISTNGRTVVSIHWTERSPTTHSSCQSDSPKCTTPKRFRYRRVSTTHWKTNPRAYQRARQQYWGQLSEDEVRESNPALLGLLHDGGRDVR